MTRTAHDGIGSNTGTLPIAMGTPGAHLRELAEPRSPGEPVKTAIARAADRSGLAYWRAFDIWYGKARRIEPFERRQIMAAVADRRRRALQSELHHIRVQLTRLEAALSHRDDEFFAFTTKETVPATGAV